MGGGGIVVFTPMPSPQSLFKNKVKSKYALSYSKNNDKE